jgi:AraC family transcriptional regulator
MLEQDDLPIAAIAYAVGFSSQSHMTTVFQKIFGATPGTIRKAAQ